ncbi:pyrimidine/purine nucleoside phosphorylase [Echinimonas agarilytica]|uniref:Pyrimidine/purine nucleoside phosphorylase n=1 Tax=Echinimonas agarilytica TaxID=1215918 RepID=A0AA41W5X9_9GAMM|nr:pyrimidine/purine nucleoside phosphorylase [Echinimonas agarilytica]MCM2679485.1 pyrimidine/purine nucleoside phosphorylase [Echinimonas agarilytica]
MSQFDNVSIIKKANIYFDGKVSSRTVQFADGTHKTLGLMAEGDYTFSTEAAELMEILAGHVEVKLAGQENWQTVVGGESFNVDANSSFDIKVTGIADYCCSYL